MGLRLVIENTADCEYTVGGTNILFKNKVEYWGLRLVIEYTADCEYTAGGTNILFNIQVEIWG